MANRSADPEDSGDAPEGGGSTAGTPRWVKAFWIIVAVVIALFVILQFVGAGGHGPGRHGGDTDTPPAGMTEDEGHTPPSGVDHGGPGP